MKGLTKGRIDRRTARQVSRFFLAEGGRLWGDDGPVRSVALRRCHSALLVKLDCDGIDRQAVVKTVGADAHLPTADCLLAVHRRVRQLDASLAQSTPWLRRAWAGGDWIVSEFIAGPTLEDLLRQSLRDGHGGPCDLALQRTAGILAALTRIPAAQVGLPAEPAPNAAYLKDFPSLWARSPLRRFLSGRFQSPDALPALMGDAFAARKWDRLLMVDSQPKNIIVAEEEAFRPYFIDIDYTCGSPAMALAHFLVSMDRLAMPRPSQRADSIRRWQRLLVEAFGREADPTAVDEVVFFYPWLLTRVAALHARTRPWLKSLLLYPYGRQLARFCDRCCDFSPRGDPRAVGELFSPLDPQATTPPQPVSASTP